MMPTDASVNVQKIVKDFLVKEGYDGLCNQEEECECTALGVAGCDLFHEDCLAGHKVFDEKGFWRIVPGKKD